MQRRCWSLPFIILTSVQLKPKTKSRAKGMEQEQGMTEFIFLLLFVTTPRSWQRLLTVGASGTEMQVSFFACLPSFRSDFSTTSLPSRPLARCFFRQVLSGPRFWGNMSTAPATPPMRLSHAASRPRSDPVIQTSSPLAQSSIPM